MKKMNLQKRKALGRGLETLLPAARGATATAQAPADAVRDLRIEHIDRNRYQTRARMDEAALNELAASIKANGVMQPIVVRPLRDGRFELIAGERRWLASQRAGKQTVPAIVRQVSDQQALELTIIENLQREDLGPMEQAQAFDRLSREFNVTQEQMAQRTGKDRTSIANYIRLLKLPHEVQEELKHNQELTFSHAKLLLTLNSEEEIRRIAKEIVSKHLSTIQTEALIFNLKNPSSENGHGQTIRPADPNVRAAERELEQALGVRVFIKDRKGKGRIIIEYATLEDFDRIVEALSRK
ncbi:MAG TPA: ParB/RepB/Spo0J family partition protein [Terriglobales bacterium]|jgi:ParB family chromosome partitioning protein|nr:ParB/RepB/Spo0J family partition protein [Terriglobales bacterium]